MSGGLAAAGFFLALLSGCAVLVAVERPVGEDLPAWRTAGGLIVAAFALLLAGLAVEVLS